MLANTQNLYMDGHWFSIKKYDRTNKENNNDFEQLEIVLPLEMNKRSTKHSLLGYQSKRHPLFSASFFFFRKCCLKIGVGIIQDSALYSGKYGMQA